jgi:CDP-diacylglycerol--glycerol-3-phosphate 3-phosphatidyltransferase
VTKLGILLDPLADKLLTAAAFLSLLEMGAIPAWMVFIMLGRELAVTALRNVAAGRKVIIPSSTLGKWKMVTQVVVIFALLLARRFESLEGPARLLLWVTVVVTVVSGIDYFRRFWRQAFGTPVQTGP